MANLTLLKNDKNSYHAVFRNDHGRVIFLSVILLGGYITLKECFYLDREHRPEPKKLTTSICPASSLLDVIRNELDNKSLKSVRFDDSVVVSKETLIATHLAERKPKILIMLSDESGRVIRTVFKSKHRRAIYLEIGVDAENIATIKQCYYVDKRARGKKIPPQGLITVRFEFSLKNLLDVINKELEAGFNGAIVSNHHTLKLDRPICGAI